MAGDIRKQSLFEFIQSASYIPPPGLAPHEREEWTRDHFIREARRLRQIPEAHAQRRAQACEEIAMAVYGPRNPS